MIVEDSATTRELLVYALAAEHDIEIVAVAEDGAAAVALVAKARPDIILMDINMPRLNGYEASRTIMEEHPLPILLMTATWELKEVEKIIESMHIGVVGAYEKPYGPGHPRYKELYEKIVAGIRLMSDVKVIRRWKPSSDTKSGNFDIETKKPAFIVIGSSTGGPPILHTILKGLPSDYPLPILVAQHMSSEFIESFVQWLNFECAVNVKIAQEGEKILGGNVYIAPAGHHLILDNNRIKLPVGDANELFTPSVSKLFSSVRPCDAPNTVAILLSGMGSDGADATVELRKGGAITVGQNEATSVVFGMVKEAIKGGGIEFLLPPQGILELLLKIGAATKEHR
ncbi:MAG: chemotaxis protein CheB [Sulfuricurvum sp.]|jgi:two-component system chemotaxis response regulator CheB|uniref:chemotaxis protein CheB n=1 Tax=Sulfuricurvum sp. TaxID=2025608 RepID=UPI0025F691BD|nr:chemotaxis protein CheB [Sulfuricurvum sp.]MCK9374463.1 chemotaxis protein CheB [Sulfuricurvum sp.]